MASDYKQASPGADLFNIGLGATSGFGGSQSGSDYGFGTPQSLNIDTLMQGSGNSGVGAATLVGYHAGGIQDFGGTYDGNMLTSPVLPNGGGQQQQHRPSMASLQDGSSPAMGRHHRLSISSTSAYPNLERQASMSDSPGAQQLQSSIGENTLASRSNETINTQAQGGDDRSATTEGPPPPWSELKTKAGKDRKRLPLACMACRRKKIRCSGEKPACKHCLRSRIPCVYKVTTRKAAPRTDYMAMLDKRLKRMEERVIKIIPKEEQGIITSTGRAVVRPPLPPPLPKPHGASKKRGAEQAFGDELDEWASARATTEGKKQDVQPDAEQESLEVRDAEEYNLLVEGADKLPPKELQEHLSEVFFDYVYGQSYHLLHKPSFMRKLAQGNVPPVLMLAVCAISARFSNHPAVRTEPAFLRGENWAAPAREIALRRYDTPNLTILIVYLLLGLHEFGTCQGGRSWMFGGMAQRMAYALQLHKDLDHDPKLRRGSDGKNGEGDLTFTDREIRRRTMWSCFLMDRFNSSGTDRPVFVAEQYIRAQLPIKENYYQMEITGPTEDLDGNVPNPVEPDAGQLSDARENMGVAAYLVRLVAIWGRLIHYLNLGGKERDQHPMWSEASMFQSIKRAAEEWKEALPPSLHYSSENLQNHASEKIANQFIFLHIVYNQIILFMNRFALPTPGSRLAFSKDMPMVFIQNASRTAFEAANQISALIHEATDHLVVAPFAGYCAFFSSTVHINGAFSKNAQLEATSKQNLAWNVKYLTKMKKHWGMFHFVTENLRDLYRRHADAARSGAAQGRAAEGLDSGIFQYGDWFDRYPHGVSGTDYEEPSAEVKKEPGADAVLGQKSDLQTVEEFFSKLSPPSRAAHQQAQQQSQLSQQAKKNAAKKRRASKSSSASAVTGSQQQSNVTHGSQQFAVNQQAPSSRQEQPQQPQQHLQQQGMHANMLSSGGQDFPSGGSSGMDTLRQHSIAFPPGFQAPPNPLLLNSGGGQHLMSELDRQMVLSSYAGLDLTNAHPSFSPHTDNTTNSSNNPLLHHHHQQNATSTDPLADPFNLDAFAAHHHSAHTATHDSLGGGGGGGVGGGVGGGFWGDPSTAWFMPFNMEPPSVGEDNNLFSGTSGFDWASFTGFGELGMPATGLTPQGSGQGGGSGNEAERNSGGGRQECGEWDGGV